jgi:hypothetical protein
MFEPRSTAWRPAIPARSRHLGVDTDCRCRPGHVDVHAAPERILGQQARCDLYERNDLRRPRPRLGRGGRAKKSRSFIISFSASMRVTISFTNRTDTNFLNLQQLV